MIFGLGIDIVSINRLRTIIKKNSKFKQRIFAKVELLNCKKKEKQISCLAKRFAAKEAFSKSLGTGIAKGLNFNEIIVLNNRSGKPYINLVGESLKTVKNSLKKKKI